MYYRNHMGSMALDDQCFVAIVGPAYGRSCCFWKTVRFACRQLLPTPEAGRMTQRLTSATFHVRLFLWNLLTTAISRFDIDVAKEQQASICRCLLRYGQMLTCHFISSLFIRDLFHSYMRAWLSRPKDL